MTIVQEPEQDIGYFIRTRTGSDSDILTDQESGLFPDFFVCDFPLSNVDELQEVPFSRIFPDFALNIL